MKVLRHSLPDWNGNFDEVFSSPCKAFKILLARELVEALQLRAVGGLVLLIMADMLILERRVKAVDEEVGSRGLIIPKVAWCGG